MTKHGTTITADLDGLLEERARYEHWLEALEARREATPAHVFERVRDDYSSRLRNVTEQLGGRTGELETNAASLAEQVATLYAEENERRDERAEAELRAAVGEYTAEQTEAIVERCDAAVADLSARRGTLGEELAKVQGILTLIRASGYEPPAPPAADREDEAPDAADAETDAQAPVAEGAASAAALAADAVTIDHHFGFDHDVDEPSVESPVEEAEPEVTPVTAADAEPLIADAEPLIADEPAPEVVEPAAPAERAAAAPREFDPLEVDLLPSPLLPGGRRMLTPARPTATGVREGNGLRSRPAMLTPNGVPTYLRDVPAEQAKTLKCQECGTMNFATEWYCERCGGELAAL